MAALTDSQIGIKKESTYGTPVTVDRFYTMEEGTTYSYEPRRRQSMGLQVGSRFPLGARSVMRTPQAEVTLKVALQSKHLGLLWEAGLGVIAHTVVSGSTYQQRAHTGITGVVLPSYTIQIGHVRNDGNVDPKTFAGCTAKSLELDFPGEDSDDGPTLTIVFDALSMATATGLASASYATSPYLFDASQCAGGMGLGGSVTVPTTTALGSGPTSFADVKSWNLKVEHGVDVGRWVQTAQRRNQPTAGVPKATLTAEIEYNALTVPTAIIAGTLLPFYATYTTSEALSSGFSQFQAVIPQMVLNKDLPAPSRETVVMSVEADILEDGTNEAVYIVHRTADTAA